MIPGAFQPRSPAGVRLAPLLRKPQVTSAAWWAEVQELRPLAHAERLVAAQLTDLYLAMMPDREAAAATSRAHDEMLRPWIALNARLAYQYTEFQKE